MTNRHRGNEPGRNWSGQGPQAPYDDRDERQFGTGRGYGTDGNTQCAACGHDSRAQGYASQGPSQPGTHFSPGYGPYGPTGSVGATGGFSQPPYGNGGNFATSNYQSPSPGWSPQGSFTGGPSNAGQPGYGAQPGYGGQGGNYERTGYASEGNYGNASYGSSSASAYGPTGSTFGQSSGTPWWNQIGSSPRTSGVGSSSYDQTSQGGRWQSPERSGSSSWGGSSSFRPQPGRGPKGYKRSNERIREEIGDQIMLRGIDADDVTVTVADGEVTLEGTVQNRETKRILEDMAEGVLGVKDVTNRIRVSANGEPSGRESDELSSQRPSSSQKSSQSPRATG